MSVATGTAGAAGDPHGEVFVGRLREFDQLSACAAKVRDGEAWLAVIEGEAGIGKSALGRRLAASLEDFTVMWAAGDPSETDLPGGVVGQLMRRLDRDVAAGFPLLAHDGPVGASPHAVGGQLLLLLGALEDAGGPVAVVVDDAHWADRLSLQVLGFVLRRLWADRVLTVLLTRSDAERTHQTLDRLTRSLDSFEDVPGLARAVGVVDLLDDVVDLTPTRLVRASRTETDPAELDATRRDLAGAAKALGRAAGYEGWGAAGASARECRTATASDLARGRADGTADGAGDDAGAWRRRGSGRWRRGPAGPHRVGHHERLRPDAECDEAGGRQQPGSGDHGR